MHLENAHVSHTFADAEGAHVPPSSLEPPAPPPPPEPPPPVVEEPAEPAEPLDGPPSLLAVVSVVHAPRTTITADANAQPVTLFIVSLLAMGYFKLPAMRDAPVLRPPSSTARMMGRVYLTIVSDESNCRLRAAIRQRSPLPFTGDSTSTIPPRFRRC